MRTDEAVLRAAASDLVTAAIGALAEWLNASADKVGDPVDDSEEGRAAALLGVHIDAEPHEIRAALRARIVLDNAHPDHGGDGVHAAELINAQNLLLARARARLASLA